MKDDELISPPKSVVAEGWLSGGVFYPSYFRSLRVLTRQAPKYPLTWMWLQTFDQDPVAIPEAVFSRYGFNKDHGPTRARSAITMFALRVWGKGVNVHPEVKAFLSLFLPNDAEATLPTKVVMTPEQYFRTQYPKDAETAFNPTKVDLTRNRVQRLPESTIKGATMGPGYRTIEVGYDDQSGEEFGI